jgi:tRNA pseudouridine55 synthase
VSAGDTTAPGATAAPALSGILVVAKPAGPTSHDVVALVRRLTGQRRVGHGGTLDPFASGVLPVFLGAATRVVEYHMADAKAYRAIACFGARSSTDDLQGELTPGEGSAPSREAVETVLARFRGTIVQRPPDFSAVKVAGRRAYELARRGEKPELRERTVEIRAIALTGWDGSDPARPCATIEVECSAGTYIRALARDLGDALGCGAYLGALVRTASGPFRIDEAIPLDVLRAAAAADEVATHLLPPDAGLEAFPAVALPGPDLATLATGQVVRPRNIRVPEPGPDGLVRVVDETGRLVAMARVHDGRLQPEKVLVPREGAASGGASPEPAVQGEP